MNELYTPPLHKKLYKIYQELNGKEFSVSYAIAFDQLGAMAKYLTKNLKLPKARLHAVELCKEEEIIKLVHTNT